MSGVTQADVLQALSQVQDPELRRDLVSLKMIKDIQISGTNVAFTVELTTPACPLRQQIQRDAENAVLALEPVLKR
jgi:ATP-binding protein involved in chromosome partitioning